MCSPFARCRPITLYQPVYRGVPLNHPIQVCEFHEEPWPCSNERLIDQRGLRGK